MRNLCAASISFILMLAMVLCGAVSVQAQYLDTISALGYSDDPTDDVFTGPDQFGCTFSGKFDAIKSGWTSCVNAKADSNTGIVPVDISTYGFDNFRNLRPIPSYPDTVYVPPPADYYISMVYAADMYSYQFDPLTFTFVKVYSGSSDNFGLQSTRALDCPIGFTLAFGLCERGDFDQSKNDGDCPQACGNPINQGTGTKSQVEIDYQHQGFDLLQIERYYTSTTRYRGIFGKKWRSNYDASIGYYESATINTAVVRRASSKTLYFNQSGSDWITDSDNNYTLTQYVDDTGVDPVTYWRLMTPENDEEIYDALSGKLVSITKTNGYKVTLTYDKVQSLGTLQVLDHLLSVTDSFDRSLLFSYDPDGRVATITNPDSQIYQYTYDANGYLASVTYPDSTSRQYAYSGTVDGALTGITDEKSNLFASWTYDVQGRAASSEHAGGVDRVDIEYDTDSATVTDSLGAVRTYTFGDYLGVRKTDAVTGDFCTKPECGDALRTYDANGNLASRTDFNGNKTTYTFDLARNLETSRTEGLTSVGGAVSGVTRTITTAWHATLRLPLEISEYSGATASGTPLKTTTYDYDAKGNLIEFTESDPALNQDRTTTIAYTYSGTVPGLVLTKVIDGPRTDVTDTTTMTYYDETSNCVGCRGQVKDMTDALGHTTHFTDYDVHGQLLESTDANGLVSSWLYDSRQRLTSITVGTQTTTLDYDAAGLIELLTLPDNSTLAYTYDAAQRLTQIEDSLGNKVVYTLDTEGNRTQEDIYDPLHVLSKRLERSYDILGRLQQQTGVEQ